MINLKCIIITTILSATLGLLVGGFSVYQYTNTEYYKIYKTNIGMMVFVKDKIYNLSEMKSMD
jgi:hypothetical protein